MFAIIRLGGHQYAVKEGDIITANLGKVSEKEFECREVLVVADGANIKIGKPLVTGASVKAQIVAVKRGRKIRVFKYHSKTRYRKTIGFRPIVTALKIEKITTGR